MKLLILSTSDNLISGQQKTLEDSLIKHGYDYEFYLYGFQFGSQYKVIKQWADDYKGDATHILYTDCWDTLALGKPWEVINKFQTMNYKMVISTEKAYFPDNGESHLYPEAPTQWKYVNGGGCIFELEFFKSLSVPFPEPMMDPYWLRDCFLQHPNEIQLDYHCEIFQTLGHSNRDEWEVNGSRIINKATGSNPIFIHGNGRTDMQWVKEL